MRGVALTIEKRAAQLFGVLVDQCAVLLGTAEQGEHGVNTLSLTQSSAFPFSR